LYLSLYDAGIVHRFPDWGSYVWPTSIGLMATDGHETERFLVLEIEAISVVLNALLWFIVGMLLSLLVSRFASERKTGPEA